jgi:hypothetical protein
MCQYAHNLTPTPHWVGSIGSGTVPLKQLCMLSDLLKTLPGRKKNTNSLLVDMEEESGEWLGVYLPSSSCRAFRPIRQASLLTRLRSSPSRTRQARPVYVMATWPLSYGWDTPGPWGGKLIESASLYRLCYTDRPIFFLNSFWTNQISTNVNHWAKYQIGVPVSTQPKTFKGKHASWSRRLPVIALTLVRIGSWNYLRLPSYCTHKWYPQIHLTLGK